MIHVVTASVVLAFVLSAAVSATILAVRERS